MNQAYLLLGSNEGERQTYLEEALRRLSLKGTILRRSAIYETAAWGLKEQADYLNLVVLFETALNPSDLLTLVQQIETRLGRQRETPWGQRTLDIDILVYNEEVINEPDLKVPHPFLTERRFTLEPLAEIAPQLVHPISGKRIETLLAECPDELPVTRWD